LAADCIIIDVNVRIGFSEMKLVVLNMVAFEPVETHKALSSNDLTNVPLACLHVACGCDDDVMSSGPKRPYLLGSPGNRSELSIILPGTPKLANHSIQI
jgi:hypothetical protein